MNRKQLLAVLLAFGAPLLLAQIPGQIPSGTVLGNSTAGTALSSAQTITAMLDRAVCATNNSALARLSGVWSCLASANNGVWITSGAGVPSISSTLPNAVQDNITRLGTVTSGVWNGTDIAYANIAQGSALSVLGVAGNALADNASIVAGTDHQVLRRSGTAVGFGAVNLGQAAAITGNLPVANLNNGTGANNTTFWRGDGTWAAATATGIAPTIQVFSSSGTWNKPGGLIAAYIECVGAGGGGGGSAATAGTPTASGGGGGGSGGFSARLLAAASLGSSETVTIATGGAGGGVAASGSAGSGNTDFGTAPLLRGGAGGGGTGAAAVNFTIESGGSGGTASSGDINVVGGPGLGGVSMSAQALGGHGGNSFYGGGGRAIRGSGSAQNGGAGSVGGGGGGGSSQGAGGSAGASGGNGGDGKCTVIHFF